jgi:hypothetical protein
MRAFRGTQAPNARREATRFYLRHGFIAASLGVRTLPIPMESIRAFFRPTAQGSRPRTNKKGGP